MKLLLKNCLIIDANSKYHLQRNDIAIVDGRITEIKNEINEIGFEKILKSANLCLSVGWVDGGVHYRDPGFERTESLESLSRVGAAGGFTAIVGFPNTQPVVQSKESLSYFNNFSKNKPTKFHNYAAVTINAEGKDFTDMIDLNHNGALAFSDGNNTIQSSDILLKTLLYLEPLNSVLVNKSEDKYLSMYGQMHEGHTSTLMGLKGIPSAAEEIMIMRDLKLLEYSEIKRDKPILHFSTISTKESVNLIRSAKKKGLPVSCDIAAHQLAFTDSDLSSFDSNLKVSPPFRAQSDIEALKQGLADGTIDMIISDHFPHDSEHKEVEFDHAEFGIIGLQTAFAVANTFSNLEINVLVEKLSVFPRKLFGLKSNNFETVDELANITIFDPEKQWVYEAKNNVSLSRNSPLFGLTLKGKVLGIINDGYEIIFEDE